MTDGVRKRPLYTNVALWLVLGTLAWLTFDLMNRPERVAEIPYDEFVAAVDKGDVAEVTLQGPTIRGHYWDGRVFRSQAPDLALLKRLSDQGVQISTNPAEASPRYFQFALRSALFLVVIAVWMLFKRMKKPVG